MSTSPDAPVQRRRRGVELENALLEAAWSELVEVGFAGLSMESVAARAHTGVAVLYRRWPNKADMVIAAIAHYGATHELTVPDTGSLRGDVIALMTEMSTSRAEFIEMAAAAGFSGLMNETGLTGDQLRDRFLGENRVRSSTVIYERAQHRGESDLGATPTVVLDLPFDMVRHDLFTGRGPLSAQRIRSIVDDVFLPLVRRPAH